MELYHYNLDNYKKNKGKIKINVIEKNKYFIKF